uniref:Phosphoglycerate mutase n=1 Tax=Panagrolaimus superbus TaxID=310955 RepID=A0A914Y6S0_9BILA
MFVKNGFDKQLKIFWIPIPVIIQLLQIFFIKKNLLGNILIVSHGSPIAAIHKVLGNTNRDIGYCALSYFVVTKGESNDNDEDEDAKNGIHAKYNFKCVFAGDMTHLSQKTEVVYPVIHPDKNPTGIIPAPMKAPS